MKLPTIIYATIMALSVSANDKTEMPKANESELTYRVNINCYSEDKPDVTLSWYLRKEGDQTTPYLTAKRIGKEHPYAFVIKDGITILDNGINTGMKEDGYADGLRDFRVGKEKSICEDMPKDIII